MALLVLFTASCAKSALEKAEVEAQFKQKATLPTVTIASQATPHPAQGTATVSITVTGATGLDSLEVGVLSCDNSGFTSTSYVAVPNPADGTFSVEAKVKPGMTNYIKACVGCTSGSAYSEAITVDVPDVPFIYKAAGVFTAKGIADHWGDTYDFEVTIVPDEKDPEHKCMVLNLEPYLASNGLTADKGYNIFEGIVDCEKNTITLPNYQSFGLSGVFLISFTDTSKSVESPLTFVFNSAGDKCICDNCWGLYSSGGWYALYDDAIELTKK